MKFSIKDFSSKFDQIRSFLEKSLMENFIFFAVHIFSFIYEVNMLFNPFYTTGVFLNPLETSGHLWFSDVFKENRKRLVAWNGLTMPSQRKCDFSVNNSSWNVRIKSAAFICPNMHFGGYASPIIFSKKLTYSGSHKNIKNHYKMFFCVTAFFSIIF